MKNTFNTYNHINLFKYHC